LRSRLDGDPKNGGKAFGMDDISRIHANDYEIVKSVYHANSCGEHTLFLQGFETPIRGKATVRVTGCQTAD
jgi:hypothetical protein